MERHLDQQLADLKNELVVMGSRVEMAIFESIESLKQLDRGRADKVISDDKIIDDLENAIDEKCLELLALQQPMAIDLRFIAMEMKISTDLERMADLAVDIAQRVLELADKPLLKPLIDIPKLAVIAQEMTRGAIESFLNLDAELAKKLILRDKEADAVRNLVQQELINDYISIDKKTIPRAIPLLLVARHLERICDHATNICEDVIYMIEAKVVKHHPEKLQES